MWCRLYRGNRCCGSGLALRDGFRSKILLCEGFGTDRLFNWRCIHHDARHCLLQIIRCKFIGLSHKVHGCVSGRIQFRNDRLCRGDDWLCRGDDLLCCFTDDLYGFTHRNFRFDIGFYFFRNLCRCFYDFFDNFFYRFSRFLSLSDFFLCHFFDFLGNVFKF